MNQHHSINNRNKRFRSDSFCVSKGGINTVLPAACRRQPSCVSTISASFRRWIHNGCSIPSHAEESTSMGVLEGRWMAKLGVFLGWPGSRPDFLVLLYACFRYGNNMNGAACSRISIHEEAWVRAHLHCKANSIADIIAKVWRQINQSFCARSAMFKDFYEFCFIVILIACAGHDEMVRPLMEGQRAARARKLRSKRSFATMNSENELSTSAPPRILDDMYWSKMEHGFWQEKYFSASVEDCTVTPRQVGVKQHHDIGDGDELLSPYIFDSAGCKFTTFRRSIPVRAVQALLMSVFLSLRCVHNNSCCEVQHNSSLPSALSSGIVAQDADVDTPVGEENEAHSSSSFSCCCENTKVFMGLFRSFLSTPAVDPAAESSGLPSRSLHAKEVNFDLWKQLLQFSRVVNLPSMHGYRQDMSCWHSTFDSFADWYQRHSFSTEADAKQMNPSAAEACQVCWQYRLHK